ncbi:hypothetical protein MNBD_NITROSPINAE01-1902 [hydrothermal vent metagenome]|uniref:Zinc finger DksA/TraR C4-type domain-containing protein n=1 Tax=hydrothermal vent metagenome TaxID=652676 RepID=A0A3B1CLM4_9ZZZZ
MKAKEYSEIRKVLLRKKALLLKTDSDIAKDLQEEIDARHGDSADIAESILEQDVALFLKTKGQDELRHIEEALERMGSGEYGICAECDEDISKKRLEILPYSIYCVACQEEMEHKVAS